MTDNKIIIYGTGKLGKLLHYYFSHDCNYDVVAFTADKEYITGKTFCDLPAVPFEDVQKVYPVTSYKMFVAVGYQNMRIRKVMYEKAKLKGFKLVNYISNRALVSEDSVIGENNSIMANVHIEPFVTIGNNNLFWSDSLVSHGLKVGDHNVIGAKCVFGGDAKIDDLCFIGPGAIILDGVVVRNETHIIAGATLFNNSKEFTKYMGNPAREVGRHRESGIIIER